MNLLLYNIYDRNRVKLYHLDEIFYYANWENAESNYDNFKLELKRIWKKDSLPKILLYRLYENIIEGPSNIKRYFKRKKTDNGRWGSFVINRYYDY